MCDTKSFGAFALIVCFLALALLFCSTQGQDLANAVQSLQAVSVPRPAPGENVNGDLAKGHIEERHPAAVAFYEQIISGNCQPTIYQGDGCEPYGDGAKAYIVCEMGNRRIVVPLLWDAIGQEWVVMTAFFSGQDYIDRTIKRDGCKPVYEHGWWMVGGWDIYDD